MRCRRSVAMLSLSLSLSLPCAPPASIGRRFNAAAARTGRHRHDDSATMSLDSQRHQTSWLCLPLDVCSLDTEGEQVGSQETGPPRQLFLSLSCRRWSSPFMFLTSNRSLWEQGAHPPRTSLNNRRWNGPIT